MAYTFIVGTAAQGNSTTVTTSSINTTGATLIVVAIGSNTGSLTELTDSKSNKWWILPPLSNTPSAIEIAYSINPTAGSGHTFTFTGSFPGIAVAAFGGAAGGAEFVSSAQTSGALTIQPGSITPSMNNSLLVSGWNASGNPTTLSINSSFTISNKSISGTGNAIGIAYLIQTTSGSVNPTWTITTTNQNMAVYLASFQLAGSSGGGGGTTGFASA